MAKAMRQWAPCGLVAFLVGCDHATKAAAEDALVSGRVITLVRGWLELRFARNFDTAFSLTHGWGGPSKAAVLTAVMVVTSLAVALLAWTRRKRASTVERVAFALVLAGAVGNTLDRLRRGYVVDFVYLHHWPIFNVADILVVIGTGFLAYGALAGRRPLPQL
jgi:signal peptidase II